MRWHNRVIEAGLLALLIHMCQCQSPPTAVAPEPRTSSDLLVAVPAQVQGLVWAPDFDKGVSSATAFAAAVLEPNALAMFDAFQASTGADLRTAQGWHTAGVDTAEGLALLMDGWAPPTLVVRTGDTVRLDKFINLYAETRNESDGHAIGAAHGTTVHSYRDVHWAHVGAYTWLTLEREGRSAMVRMLQHMQRDNDAVAPDHPVGADSSFLRDMKQVKAAAWMGWRGARFGALGPWALALEMGKAGWSSQIFVGSDANTVSPPAAVHASSIGQLTRRFRSHDLLFLAAEQLDVDKFIAPEPPPAPAPKGRQRPAAPTPKANGAGDANQRPRETAAERAFSKLTGLNWRTSIAPNIRGATFGLGLAGADDAAVHTPDISLTVDVADASQAAGWLVLATQTLARQNIVFRPAVQTFGSTAFTVYQSEQELKPALTGQGNDLHLALRLAVVGKTIVLATGPAAFDAQVRALLQPTVDLHPLLSQEGMQVRLEGAQQYSVWRLGLIGAALTKGLGSDAKPLNVESADWLPPLAKVGQRIGDITETSTPTPGGWLMETTCDLTTLPLGAAEPKPEATQDSANAASPTPGTSPGDAGHERFWLHSPVGRSASFVRNLRYNKRIYLSHPDAVNDCRRTCWDNPRCSGFFEQTKSCPEPHRNDHKSDPTRTRGRGCVRLCGFYTKGQNPLRGKLTGGPPGAVWLKSEVFAKRTPEKWFGPKVIRTAGP